HSDLFKLAVAVSDQHTAGPHCDCRGLRRLAERGRFEQKVRYSRSRYLYAGHRFDRHRYRSNRALAQSIPDSPLHHQPPLGHYLSLYAEASQQPIVAARYLPLAALYLRNGDGVDFLYGAGHRLHHAAVSVSSEIRLRHHVGGDAVHAVACG